MLGCKSSRDSDPRAWNLVRWSTHCQGAGVSNGSTVMGLCLSYLFSKLPFGVISMLCPSRGLSLSQSLHRGP